MDFSFINLIRLNPILGQQGFRELVADACGEDREIQRQLVLRLSEAGDPKEGFYWAKRYKLQLSEMPFTVRELYREAEPWTEGNDPINSSTSNSILFCFNV